MGMKLGLEEAGRSKKPAIAGEGETNRQPNPQRFGFPGRVVGGAEQTLRDAPLAPFRLDRKQTDVTGAVSQRMQLSRRSPDTAAAPPPFVSLSATPAEVSWRAEGGGSSGTG